MRIIFVMGFPCVGKSRFIQENFPDMELVDLIDYQKEDMTINDIWTSYEECAKALQKCILENKDVVLEHTLMRAIRRKYYLDIVREMTNAPVDLYCLIAPQEILEKHYEQRFEEKISDSAMTYLSDSIKTLEMPSKSEKFNSINIIRINE